MNDFYDTEIDRLHDELAHLYRNKSTDGTRIDGLWARIERLETSRVRVAAKESRLAGP